MVRPRIGLLSAEDTRRREAASGTPYYLARALERRVGPVRHLGPVFALHHLLGRLRSGLSLVLTGSRRPYHHTRGLAREYARRLGRRIPDDLDLLVAPFAATELSMLETELPVVYTSDATLPAMAGYNDRFPAAGAGYDEAVAVERAALRRAAALIYPSEWAAGSARRDHGVPASKIHVQPYGANLSPEVVPPRDRLRSAKPGDRFVVLFVGVDWERKGGPVAREAVRLAREAGVSAELVICGCDPPPAAADEPWVRTVGRIDKARRGGEEELSRLLLGASVLLLPTRTEAFGLVFCEASAHGTPSIAPDTGGVGGAIAHGENGLLLPADASGPAYAEVLVELFRDRDRYEALSRSSRDSYERRRNWERFADRVGELAGRLVARAAEERQRE